MKPIGEILAPVVTFANERSGKFVIEIGACERSDHLLEGERAGSVRKHLPGPNHRERRRFD